MPLAHPVIPSFVPLAGPWEVMCVAPGSIDAPVGLDARGDWIAAEVPGTLAAALEKAGRWSREAPTPLHDCDTWWRTRVQGKGLTTLIFDGLATRADVYLDDTLILESESMFRAHRVDCTLTGAHRLTIRFCALNRVLAALPPAKRARYRPLMIDKQGLRQVRTTLLGHMPGWSPGWDHVGPFRAVGMVDRTAPLAIGKANITPRVEGTTGHLRVVLADMPLNQPEFDDEIALFCAGQRAVFTRTGDGTLIAELAIPDVELWWPHTHGAPVLHDVIVTKGAHQRLISRTGFRTITRESGDDGRGFGLLINGERVYCRGAVFTPADGVRLPTDRAELEPMLRLAQQAGFNMLRLSGTMLYEAPAFYSLCDELGILVWQDAMLANFDYPAADPAFAAEISAEWQDLLERLHAAPSLAVLCGGSEMAQQAAMLGLPETHWSNALTREILPQIAQRLRPDCLFIANSPWGGSPPFRADEGVTHYYGVGAYLRPLDDARRAQVRFASECLAFANVPERETLEAALPVAPLHHPQWKARVPRDRGASWDFEDVREFYLGALYGLDPARLRREDAERYLDFSRAVSAEVMEASIAEWRRPGSPTRGALVWYFRDFLPGAGWGLIDALDRPKAAYYGVARACRPVSVLVSDEGVNGLKLHAINESARALEVEISLTAWRDGAVPVVSGRQSATLPPRGSLTMGDTELFGAFFDTSYAYRFGPPAHDVTVARMCDAATGLVLAEAFHFPSGRGAALAPATLHARLEHDEAGTDLVIATDRFAQSVAIACTGAAPADNWFHLAPDRPRRIRLHPSLSAIGEGPPLKGDVRALNAPSTRFGVRV